MSGPETSESGRTNKSNTAMLRPEFPQAPVALGTSSDRTELQHLLINSHVERPRACRIRDCRAGDVTTARFEERHRRSDLTG